MASVLTRPTNPYDPSWVEYRLQNPGLRLSLSAGSEEDETIDLSFLPESYKGDDDKYDVETFKADYDGLVSFKAQADERAALVPEKPDDYKFDFNEDHEFPEGFDPTSIRVPVLDDKGEQIFENGELKTRDFTVKDMVKDDDPDLPALRELLHKHQASPDLMKELGGLLGNREIRSVMEDNRVAAEEKAKLGADGGQSRISTISRAIKSMLPKEQATALLTGITSADGIKAFEALLGKTIAPPPPAGKQLDMATASIDERITAGLEARSN